MQFMFKKMASRKQYSARRAGLFPNLLSQAVSQSVPKDVTALIIVANYRC